MPSNLRHLSIGCDAVRFLGSGDKPPGRASQAELRGEHQRTRRHHGDGDRRPAVAALNGVADGSSGPLTSLGYLLVENAVDRVGEAFEAGALRRARLVADRVDQPLQELGAASRRQCASASGPRSGPQVVRAAERRSWVVLRLHVNFVPDGVVHVGRTRLRRLESGRLLLELTSEDRDLLHQQLDAIGDNRLLEEPPDLRTAVGAIARPVVLTRLCCCSNLAEPAHVVEVWQRLRIR